MPDTTNRLAKEKSPYLLQHAHNPVDWFPWGEEAFAKARAEDKPIFLSVGYSTCHWCHVMERESFEEAAVAEVMNRLFVNVKVDREERPDVDQVYMTYVQATTGSGGWPMSVFLTPELEPIFGGTYFPPGDRYGRPGFRSLCEQIGRIWSTRKDEVRRQGARVVAELARLAAGRAATGEGADALVVSVADRSLLARAYNAFAQSFDPRHGGFSGAPKFPRPSVFAFLLRWYERSGEPEAAAMVERTLLEMAKGGIHDHLAGGFARYSVDAEWHVPHFEKMLYDEAQLVATLAELLKIERAPAQRAALGAILSSTIAYVLRDLTDGQGPGSTGGFYSAEDADSPIAHGGKERAEGAFYVFTQREIEEVLAPLGERAVLLFSQHYGTSEEGNADDPHGELTGKNVLHVQQTLAESAAAAGVPFEEAERLLASARGLLRTYRDKRPRPHLDDKVLAAWNGQMIGALAQAAMVTEDSDEKRAWIDAAVRAARFAHETLWEESSGLLYRRYRDGEVAIPAYLEDHAFLANGLVDLYEATLDLGWLRFAERLVDRMCALFADAEQGGFFATAGDDPSVILRMKDDYDGAQPSGNAVAAIVCQRLGHALDRADLLAAADGTIRCFARAHVLDKAPHALPMMCVAVDTSLVPPTQIVVAGELTDARTHALLDVARRAPLPGRVVLLADGATRAVLGPRLPFVATATEDATTGAPLAYVCHAWACDRPVAEPADLARLLAHDTKATLA